MRGSSQARSPAARSRAARSSPATTIAGWSGSRSSSAATRYGRSDCETNARPPSRGERGGLRILVGVGEERAEHRARLDSQSRTAPRLRLGRSGLGRVGGALDQLLHLVPRARGSGRARRRRPGRDRSSAGRPTPTRTRAKSGEPRPCRSDFSPLWPARPPPVRTRISPNGRSISSWSTSTWSSRTFSAPRAGSDRLPGVVHVGLGQQDRHPRPAGPGAALGQQPAVPRPRPSAAPSGARAARRSRSRCCGGCPRTRCPGCRARRAASRRERCAADRAAARGPSATRRRSRRRRRRLTTFGFALGRARPRRRARSPPRSRPRPRPGGGGRERGDHGLGIVDDRDPVRSAPARRA